MTTPFSFVKNEIVKFNSANSFPLGLAYDDILLIPQKSFIDHRSEVSTETFLTPKIKLHLPFVSANMDTVTENEMAIALAKEGGIGIIHRFLTIEEQAEEVAKVKRNIGYVLGKPYTIAENETLSKIWKLHHEKGIESFIVIDNEEKITGLITRRDILFKTNGRQSIKSMMTPFSKLITSTSKTTFNEAKRIFQKYKDVAHGHNDVALRAIKEIRKKFDGIELIGGNVTTPKGALDLIKLGVNAVKKVGIKVALFPKLKKVSTNPML